MNKFLRRSILVIVVLLALGITAILCRDPFLKLAAKQAIHDATGLTVEIANFKSGLRQPVIAMQGVKLYNQAGFGQSLMLDLPDLLVEFDQDLAAQGKLRFKQLRLNLAELNVIRDTNGHLNIEKVEKEVTERNAARTNRSRPKLEFAGIDDLRLSLGRVTIRDLKKPSKNREILVNIRDQHVTGLKTGDDLEEWLGDFIFKVILQEASNPATKHKRKPVAALKEALEK